MAHADPASGVVQFYNWLEKHTDIHSGYAVDIGSGKGRNAVYLAEKNFVVYGMEYITYARNCAEQLAKRKGVYDRTKFYDCEIDTSWKFENDFFDIAIDSFSSIDIETLEGRVRCRDEMYRTLKPGGYALITVCSTDDEWEKELIANHPGPEPNSTLWPESGKFQKDYSEAELRKFYNMFSICELRTVRKPAYKLGRRGIATNLWLVIQK